MSVARYALHETKGVMLTNIEEPGVSDKALRAN
jgi:hypothetical protein